MCLICVELSKNKLTPLEARRNLGEMMNTIDKNHRLEVLRNIWKAEEEEYLNWKEQEKYGDTD
tara:strand:- start:76 stop:264 length:189 start_codon:yes stop_codon:yes gene_type:complete